MKKNSYRLSQFDREKFAELAADAEFRIAAAEPDAVAEIELGEIDGMDLDFSVVIPVKQGSIDADDMAFAKKAVMSLISMDNVARAYGESDQSQSNSSAGERDQNETLAYITVNPPFVELEYFGTEVNNQWDVVFRLNDDDKWVCEKVGRATGLQILLEAA
jgi:hypothetical protein